MTFVSELAPNILWRHFDEILQIPRDSGKEGPMRDYVLTVAARNGLEHSIDDTGNVVVRKPGTAGHENAPTVILQSHLDMVCEKNSDVEHDFDKDPIKPQRDGDYLTADGTTLGSDNGIGVAAMLALMDADDVEHGPLEFLFTIDEERGLTGAGNLDPALLSGDRLINLDSEEEGVLTVGCAGGRDSHIRVPINCFATPGESTAFRVKLHGLKGGHSGVDIHLQRGNATQLLARALFAASHEVPFYLGHLGGGDKHNAIPREAQALVVVEQQHSEEKLRAEIEKHLGQVRDEFSAVEPNLAWSFESADVPHECWERPSSVRVLRLVTGLPHGVSAMSYDIPGLVETSTNLASVKPVDGHVEIHMSSRSSVASSLEALTRRIRAIGELAGATVEEGNGYPGWKPDMGSELLNVLKGTHQEVIGTEPEVGAIHAGLECGIIGEKRPGMDMISFGPTINFPHSPDERVHIDSVDRFYRLLTVTLEQLAA